MEGSFADRVEKSINEEVEGKILFTSDYAELGTPEAVKKALLRLWKRDVIVRLAQGIYYKPRFDKELGLCMLASECWWHSIGHRWADKHIEGRHWIMNIEQAWEYTLSLNGVTEKLFGDDQWISFRIGYQPHVVFQKYFCHRLVNVWLVWSGIFFRCIAFSLKSHVIFQS